MHTPGREHSSNTKSKAQGEDTIPGTSLRESLLRLGSEITQELLKLPYVRLVAQRVVRAEAADDVWAHTTANSKWT